MSALFTSSHCCFQRGSNCINIVRFWPEPQQLSWGLSAWPECTNTPETHTVWTAHSSSCLHLVGSNKNWQLLTIVWCWPIQLKTQIFLWGSLSPKEGGQTFWPNIWCFHDCGFNWKCLLFIKTLHLQSQDFKVDKKGTSNWKGIFALDYQTKPIYRIHTGQNC